jgi:hypothetical protein
MEKELLNNAGKEYLINKLIELLEEKNIKIIYIL